MSWYAERNQQGASVGLFRCKQRGRAEELLEDSHADVVAFLAPKDASYHEAQCIAALNVGGAIDVLRVLKAKALSDEAYRLGKPPGQLTAQELAAMRQRIANIYKAL
mgnify:CR=1 FL=1